MLITLRGEAAYVYTGGKPWQPGLPVVVFVHGAANDHSVWALQSRYLAHHGCNVAAVDLPGHGRSSGAALPAVEAIADWLAELLEALAAPRAALVGHSLGSLAVMACAARHPARVGCLVLLGPAVPLEVSPALLAAARDDEPLARELITGWMFSPGRQLGGNPVPGLWLAGGALRLLERQRRGVLACDLEACANYRDGLAAAAAVCCPTLVLIGARDLMAPPKAAAALCRTLAEPRVVTLADCGHGLMLEQPDAVVDAIAAFLTTMKETA